MHSTIQKAGVISLIILAALSAIGAIRSKHLELQEEGVQAVKIYCKLDLYELSTGRRLKVNDSLLKLTGPGFTGFQYFVQADHELADRNGKTIRALPGTIEHRFFFFHAHTQTGLFYDSTGDPEPKRLRVDSMLRARFYVEGNMFYNPGNRLVGSGSLSNGGLYEKYIPATKPDETYPDSILLSYDPSLNDLNFSFNTFLDSSHQAKMNKALFVFNPTAKMPRREFGFRFNRPNSKDQIDILMVKERFLKEEKP